VFSLKYNSQITITKTTTNEREETKMLQSKNIKFFRNFRLRKIAKQVRHLGKVPKGISKETVYEALMLTRAKNAVEYFGLLSAQVMRKKDGSIEDLGLVSCKSVSLAFCKHLADAMTASGLSLDDFDQHKMGSGSTAAATGDTALVAAQSGAQAAGVAGTHGATSIVYRTVGTVTATYDSAVREHGVFSLSTGGILLDRSTVPVISVATDDVITWTYDLTCVTGG